MVDDRVGDHAHPVARGLDAPAEVNVLPVEQHAGIEAAHLVPHVAADQHPGAADGEHIPVAVVLPLVDLARLDPGDPASGAVDADPGLEQDIPVGPVHDLGAEHRHGRHLVGADGAAAPARPVPARSRRGAATPTPSARPGFPPAEADGWWRPGAAEPGGPRPRSRCRDPCRTRPPGPAPRPAWPRCGPGCRCRRQPRAARAGSGSPGPRSHAESTRRHHGRR